MSYERKFYIASDCAFQDRAPVYLFTNENISGYLYKLRDLSGARVLSVAASGDHAFEAVLRGATYVDTFDINSYQRHVLELKVRMIRALPYEDFMDFFFDNKNFFNQKIIAPISSKFSIGLQKFLARCNQPGAGVFRYNGAIAPEYDLRHITYVATRLNYQKLCDQMPEKINFHHCKLERVSARFNQRYDLIMLSNIFCYMYPHEQINENRFLKFYHNILQPLAKNNLTGDGIICFNYMWNANPVAWSNFMDLIQSQYAPDDQYRFFSRSVISAFRDTNWDTALIMQKRQR